MSVKTVVYTAICALAVNVAMARQFWSSEPADAQNIIMSAYPVGNGRLGALPQGQVGSDVVSLNEVSLWAGGPFGATNYTGGNPDSSLAHYLPGIRDWIFQNGTGNETALYGSSFDYGTYQTLANLTVDIAGLSNYTSYRRTLDLESAIHTTSFEANGQSLWQTVFCSYPDQVCVYHINSSAALPDITAGFSDNLRTSPASNSTCDPDGVRLQGQTQFDIGMIFDARVQAILPSGLNISCNSMNQMVISENFNISSVTFVWSAGTNYDQKKGTPQDNFSFKGTDPDSKVLAQVLNASMKSFETLQESHVEDFQEFYSRFIIDVPDTNSSSNIETSLLWKDYTVDEGNPFVEALLLDYGRYLFISSSRPGSLPPNLQGIWAVEQDPAWSSDYHIDINLEMNHWHTEQTGLGDIMQPLWDYMIDTWIPRGTESAQLWYNISGFVAFSNVNTFGHTGQENDATWSDYPASVAWMMKCVWDRYDYSRDAEWYQSTGYPMMKLIAQFWLEYMQEDEYFHDGTLVAIPCNSPEHGPTTFGCTHYQQIVWELFDRLIAYWNASGDEDTVFLNSVKQAYEKLDSGVHVGYWGQIQEWKLDIDVENDTHRHLSELYGHYPGYSISSIHGDNATVMNAVATTLYSRGNGTIDSNTGWEKVWRAACWATLNNTDEAYTEYKYSIWMNFAPNGLSVYTTSSGWPYELALPFQIDANFGIAAAGLAMLATDLPKAYNDNTVQRVVLGPAIPSAWSPGSVSGLRLRGGGSVDFSWDENGDVSNATLKGRNTSIQLVNMAGTVLVQL